jgi:hypothetical protein
MSKYHFCSWQGISSEPTVVSAGAVVALFVSADATAVVSAKASVEFAPPTEAAAVVAGPIVESVVASSGLSETVSEPFVDGGSLATEMVVVGASYWQLICA